MIFNSMTFIWIFLPILLLVYFLVPKKYKNIILLIFSIFFYAWGEPIYVIVMLLSILINYYFGILIDRKKKNKVIFIFSIIFNISLLVFFKYTNFFINNINSLFNLSINKMNIALPIGISFYTFQILSYLIDLYKKEIKVQKNILNLALYISFFPQLIAGPIVKYKDIEKEISERKVSIESFTNGTKRFIYGLAKKVLIADTFSFVADTIFNSNIANITTLLAWVGSISYTLQIYFDFSAYSDMAIGLGKLFGFNFKENFNLPYVSSSITDFWRRWHISLSTWFKEYVYIPLGGNRKGKLRTIINIWIVFLLTGFWHGASWTFVIWGLYHALFITIEKLFLKKELDKCKIINHIYALLVVNIGFIFFRAQTLTKAFKIIMKLFIISKNTTTIRIYDILTNKFFITLIIAILLSFIPGLITKIKKDSIKKVFRFIEIPFIFILWLLCISSIISSTYNPFIYFRF